MAIKNFLLISFLLASVCIYAQQRWVVRFTDKNNSPYSINNPQQFLSQKAIDRRIKQGISVTAEDIPVNQNYIDSVKAKGAVYINRSKWMNLVLVKVIDTTILSSITSLPFVSSVDVVKRKDTLSTLRKQNKFSSEIVEAYDYGFAENQIKIMNGDFLHDSGFLGEGMVIAVIDAGFKNVNTIPAYSHLWNENRILGYWDFANNNDSVFDKHSHGNAVLSTMAADLPGEMLGTAPKASYWLLRSEVAATESIDEEYNWLAAAEFADSVGADVINSSLGYTTFDDASQNHTYADMDGNTTIITKAADIAFTKGMLVVNSAGNSGDDIWYRIGAPADGQHVLAVGATEHDGSAASFSSRGPSYDGRVKPNVATIGRYSTVLNENGVTGYSNGTSFSSPEMAGMAAVLWQAFPDKSNAEIKLAIEESSHRYHNPNYDLGYGIPNFKTAYLNLSGYNIIDANSNQILNVYPQPFNNQFSILFYSARDQQVQIKITDITGKLIYKYNWKVGDEVIRELNIQTTFSAGIYNLQIVDGDGKVNATRIVRQ